MCVVCVCVWGGGLFQSIPVWLGFVIRVSFEKLKSDFNQTWFKVAKGIPSNDNEVKGYVPRSRVIWGQVRWKMLDLVIWVSSEKLKSDWNQTWVEDVMGIN